MPSFTSALSCVLEHVRDEEVVALAQRLVRIPSVYRPGEAGANEGAVAAVVGDWLRAEGFGVDVQEVAPGRPNVVGWIEGTPGGRTLCLEGHTDVVTEGDVLEWRHDPWAGVLEDGRIYGRGAADMKGGLAAAMVAAAGLRRARLRFAGRLVVAALVDEEGAMAGARHFVTTPLGRAMDAAIVCEPEQNELCLEQKGVMWACVTIRGRMAHAAMPYSGVNPVAAAGAFLAGLPQVERRLRVGLRRSRFLGRPHVTPTRAWAPARGIAQNNVIPSAAEVVLDVRLVPGLTPNAVLDALERLARDTEARLPGSRIHIDVVEPPRPATRIKRSEPIVQALSWAVCTVRGERPQFGGVPGSTDGTIFVAERGVPVVTFGPGNREIPHRVDEYVEISQLVEAARCYAATAVRFLGARL